MPLSWIAKLAQMRQAGWMVAHHHNYILNGEFYTVWLLTHAESGRFVKGEGHSDDEAISAAHRAWEGTDE